MAAQYSAEVPMQTPNGKRQNAPASQQRRNGSSRKAHLPPDGSLSDGALLSSVAASPRSKKTQRHRNPPTNGAYSGTEYYSSGSHAPKSRTTSTTTAALPIAAKDDLRYAGATFSASPAASNLPVPKFAARSASNVGGAPNFTKQASRSSPPEVFDSSPEVMPASPAPGPSSPLDMLFKADRAERARNMNTLSATQFGSPLNNKSMLLDEVNGDNATQSPSRPSALSSRPGLGDRTRSSPGTGVQAMKEEEERQAITRSLKGLLFNQNPPHAGSPPPSLGHGIGQPMRTPERGTHATYDYLNSGTPTPLSEQRNQNSYHYGNRNLSPLLQAARSDAPSKFNGLDQVIGSGFENPAFYPPSPTNHRQPPPPLHYNQFVGHRPNNSQGHAIPRAPFPFQQGPSSNAHPGAPQHQNVFLPPYGGPDNTGSPNAGASRDTSAMENDLRRILKLA